MKPAAALFLAAALVALAPAHAVEKGPTHAPPNWYFKLESHILEATDILIVTEGGEIDGKVTVEEVLYGPKKVGDELDFPDLAKFAPEEARTTMDDRMLLGPREGEFVPEVVPAGRMMLFLVPEGLMPGIPDYDIVPGGKPLPQPGMESHAALIKDQRIFLPSGLYREPEKLSLYEHRETLSEVREQIAVVSEERELLVECLANEDPAERAAMAVRLVSSDCWVIAEHARHILVRCGAAAIPHVEKLLSEPAPGWSDNPMHQQLIILLRGQDGDDTASETFAPLILRMVDRDLAFWEKTTPSLAPNWWNESDAEGGPSPLQQRLDHSMQLINLLGVLKTPAALAKVQEIQEFCEARPALRNTGAPYGLLDRCAVALGEDPGAD
ncbi:hypothetical protein HAHE_19920 [Haloferula helveola]|uniref:Uncharacterized protein n=1 Tax=Haloferula helveola TaxID=490095 RepID=A0ABN6H6G9_9BACT|nr:hypothetical protein HAHE_19920 [Haloferula helveola]